MSEFAIQKISSVDINMLQRVLSSREINETQKTQFVQKHKTEIAYIINNAISGKEFKYIMQNRPLQKFRPLKNSFTKLGDKKFLAKVLGIPETEIDDNISNTVESLTNDLIFLPKDKLEAIKTYVYRHGSKEQLAVFLDYELNNTNDMLETLYRTLEYHTGGVADYFIRPIHKLDNKTLVKLYGIINKNLDRAEANNAISIEEKAKISKWALIKIYQIQNNNKLTNAIKARDILS